jgi:hypothetical protein
MSRHVVEQNEKKYVFGWDQPLMSFFLQVHDLTKDEDDDERVHFVAGASSDTICYEVDALVRVAQKYGLHIPHETQVKLYGEKDDGA